MKRDLRQAVLATIAENGEHLNQAVRLAGGAEALADRVLKQSDARVRRNRDGRLRDSLESTLRLAEVFNDRDAAAKLSASLQVLNAAIADARALLVSCHSWTDTIYGPFDTKSKTALEIMDTKRGDVLMSVPGVLTVSAFTDKNLLINTKRVRLDCGASAVRREIREHLSRTCGLTPVTFEIHPGFEQAVFFGDFGAWHARWVAYETFTCAEREENELDRRLQTDTSWILQRALMIVTKPDEAAVA